MKKLGWIVGVGLLVVLANCGNHLGVYGESIEREGDEQFDSFLDGGKEDGFGTWENSSEAWAVLFVVNRASFNELRDEVHLDARAARNIVEHRCGEDGRDGTEDDQLFSNLEELDAIPYVGPSAYQALVRYAEEYGYPNGNVFISEFTAEGICEVTTLTWSMLQNHSNEFVDVECFMEERQVEERRVERDIRIEGRMIDRHYGVALIEIESFEVEGPGTSALEEYICRLSSWGLDSAGYCPETSPIRVILDETGLGVADEIIEARYSDFNQLELVIYERWDQRESLCEGEEMLFSCRATAHFSDWMEDPY